MKSKIQFKQVTKTHIEVYMEGTLVGDIWSKLSDGNTSYSGPDSIQVCGIATTSSTWQCGRYSGKDICLIFDKDVKKKKNNT